MPNAKNATGLSLHNFLIIGPGGAGKTTQYWTMPPGGFLYVFDPNCIASLSGLDLDYEIFSPDLLDINVHPMAHPDPKKGIKKADSIIEPSEPVAYTEWEKDFEERLLDGFFKDRPWIGMDSFTTFSDAVMDRVQWLNGRLGKPPEQTDYTAQMFTIQNVFRSLSGQNTCFIATAHDEAREDMVTGQVHYQPVMTGRLRTRIPLLFSNIWRMENESEKSGSTFLMHMRSDRRHQYVRVSRQIQELWAKDEDGMPPELDVTIEDFDRASDFGIGSLLRKAGLVPDTISSKSKRKRKPGKK